MGMDDTRDVLAAPAVHQLATVEGYVFDHLWQKFGKDHPLPPFGRPCLVRLKTYVSLTLSEAAAESGVAIDLRPNGRMPCVVAVLTARPDGFGDLRPDRWRMVYPSWEAKAGPAPRIDRSYELDKVDAWIAL